MSSRHKRLMSLAAIAWIGLAGTSMSTFAQQPAPDTATRVPGAQDIKIGPPNSGVLCPHPATLKLTATATPSVNTADFPNPLPTGQGVRVLGQEVMNKAVSSTISLLMSRT